MQTTYILTNAVGTRYLSELKAGGLRWGTSAYLCTGFASESQADAFLMREDVKAFLNGEFVRIKQF